MVTRVETVATALGRHVADGAVFYQKLRHFHWNVRGEEFFRLHTLFETLYERWAKNVDDLAERSITLGTTPPGTLKGFLDQATVGEIDAIPGPREMVQSIADDLGTMIDAIKDTAIRAEEEKDLGTTNLLQGLIEEEEKGLWMLRAWLGGTAKSRM